MKTRLDVALFERGLAKSREEAHALVLAGQVYLGEVKAEKAGQFVTEDANLQPNDYVDIQYQKDTSAEESGSSLYLQSMFIRTDNGKSYVMARGEDGRLEQRWVQTGRDLWGSYTQIRGWLTIDDYVAFPYGRDVVEGAHTQEATTDQLYNYGI